MILRIAREKVGHRQGLTTQTPNLHQGWAFALVATWLGLTFSRVDRSGCRKRGHGPRLQRGVKRAEVDGERKQHDGLQPDDHRQIFQQPAQHRAAKVAAQRGGRIGARAQFGGEDDAGEEDGTATIGPEAAARAHNGSAKNGCIGSIHSTSNETASSPYQSRLRYSPSRLATRFPARTMIRTPANTLVFTIQVEPKRSESCVTARVSSSMKAAPSRNICQSKRPCENTDRPNTPRTAKAAVTPTSRNTAR